MIHDATAPELATELAFRRFLANFEAGSIPHTEWTHAAHVATAAGYLQRMPKQGALDAVRDGIQNLQKHFGVETTLERGYHETLTRFWLHTCDAFLQETGLMGLEGIRALVALFGRRSNLYREYYGYDVVRNAEARYGWVPPELQPLPAAWRNGDLLVSTNPRLLHLPTIHGFLKHSYWAEDIPLSVVERSLRNSLCFGLYEAGVQAGFARVVTDLATFAYIGDVFVLESHRGRKLSQWLMQCVQTHPSLQDLRRWHLVTKDAHGLYEKFGFQSPVNAARHMEKAFPGLYREGDHKGV